MWLPLTHPQLGTWPTIQACALTGNRIDDLLVHRPALNPLSHISQGSTISFFNQKKFNEKILLNMKMSINATFKTTRSKNLSS